MDSNEDKKLKDETLKKDFRFGMYVYTIIYASLIVALIVAYVWMDLTTYVIGNIILIAMLYWVVKNKDN